MGCNGKDARVHQLLRRSAQDTATLLVLVQLLHLVDRNYGRVLGSGLRSLFVAHQSAGGFGTYVQSGDCPCSVAAGIKPGLDDVCLVKGLLGLLMIMKDIGIRHRFGNGYTQSRTNS